MINKLLILLSLLITTSVSVAAVENPFTRIRANGKIRIAAYKNPSPPFLIPDKDRSSLKGLDAEIGEYIASKLGVEVEFVNTANSFDQVVDMVEKGQADIGLSKLSITSSRAERVLFTDAYIKLPIGIVYNRLSFVKGDSQLNLNRFKKPNLKIGVLKASSYEEFAQNRFPKAKIIGFSDRDQIYVSLAKGEIDFTLADDQVIKTWKINKPALNIKTATFMIPEAYDLLGIAVSPMNYRFKEWLDVLLTETENSGRLKVLKDKYLADDYWRQK